MTVSPIFPTKVNLDDNGQTTESGQPLIGNVSVSYTLGEVSLASASNLGILANYDLVEVPPLEEAEPKEPENTAEAGQVDETPEAELKDLDAPDSALAAPHSPELPIGDTDDTETTGARYTPTQYALAITGGIAVGVLAVFLVRKFTSR